MLRLLALCVLETSPGSGPAWPRSLRATAGEHRPVSCHCSEKGRGGLNGRQRGDLFPNGWVTEGREADLLCTTPPPSCSPSALPPVRWPEKPQGVLNLTFCTFPEGSRKRKGTPISPGFLCAKPSAGHFPPLPREILPLQCPMTLGYR